MGNEQKVPFHFLNSESELNVVNLGDVIDIASASRVHKNEWTQEGVRFFRSSDVTSNFFGKDNKPAFISFDLYKSLIKKTGIVKKGDILVTGGGTIGIPYLIDNDRPLYFKDADLLWLKSRNVIDGYYLYSYFSSPSLQKYLTSISHVGTISHYTIEQAKATPIKLPTFDEQKKIGLFFKKLNDTISLHQQELEVFKQTKKGFLQKMFPENGETTPKIRFSEFGNEWESKKIKNVVSLLKDGTHGTHKDGEYAYLLSAKNIKFGKVLLNPNQDRKIAKIDYKQIYKNYELENEDLLVTIVGTIGQTALYYKDDNAIAFQRSVGIIRGNEDVSQLFLKAIFDSNLIQKQLRNSSSISAQPGVYLGDLEKMTLMLPTIDEQISIGEFFRQLDEVIELKEKELEALKETKKGFLQKMFV